MKKLVLYLIFLTPVIARSTNPPPAGLAEEPVESSIDSKLFFTIYCRSRIWLLYYFQKEIDFKFKQ
jgi:hypothetical protein